jgi:hypothetical protein
MDFVIIALLLLIFYNVYQISTRLKAHFYNKSLLDPNYPYYPFEEILKAKREFLNAKHSYDKYEQKLHEYEEAHADEIKRVKHNKDHSEEYKDIMRDLLNSQDEYITAEADYLFYVETNFAFKNSKIKAGEITYALADHFKKHHRRNDGKISSYFAWLDEHKE